MKNTPVVATHKIILFVVFISAALITSLFVFHMSHKTDQAQLSDENSMIFPAGRDIKSFELVTSDNKKFSQQDFLRHWTLLFFGFTHCKSVCPTTLSMMDNAYKKLQPLYPNLQVVLITLDPEKDTPEVLAHYTQSFNTQFIGVTGKLKEIRKLQSQLGIFSSSNQDDIQHTTSVLLINPEGKWSGLFKFGLQPEQFANIFDRNVKRLTARQ